MRVASSCGASVAERAADHLEPGAGQAVAALVEARRELVLDQVEDRARLARVARVGVEPGLVGRRDRPAVGRVVALVPPAVEDREVEHAVQRRLHAARAAGLERAQRRVEPDVDAGHEHARERHVVVGQHDHAVAHVVARRERAELLDQALALAVVRVRLAGHEQLHRPLAARSGCAPGARARAAAASAACRSGRAARSRA